MRVLLFIPCYNDSESAHRLSKKLLGIEDVEKALIVDDSDDPACIEYSRRIEDDGIEVISRRRRGKWSAWRLALERSRDYDGLIEIDADVEVDRPDLIVAQMGEYDVVTAYQDIMMPPRRAFFSRRISEVYQSMHRKLSEMSKFNMGGQVIALSKKAAMELNERGFFSEPVLADDHVISLAAHVLGLRCTTVDCGLRIRLPSRFTEWIKYRSRHRGAIGWAEDYVAEKTGLRMRTMKASREDYGIARRYFLKSLFESPNPLNLFILLFFGAFSVVAIEDQFRWSILKSTKIRKIIAVLFQKVRMISSECTLLPMATLIRYLKGSKKKRS